MGDFFKELLGKLPPLFFILASALILLFLAAILGYFLWGAKKFAEGVNKEDKIRSLQENYYLERDNAKKFEGVNAQFSTSMENIRSYIQAYKEIAMGSDQINTKISELENLIQRMIDTLAADVKFNNGEKHRCALWIASDESRTLSLSFFSSGFPPKYSRKLELDRSIAGKSYRLEQTVYVEDVNKSDEWSRNPGSPLNSNSYKSVLAFPLPEIGVLTIDGMKPISFEETRVIGELYASLFDMLVMSLFEFYATKYEALEPELV